MQISLTEHAPRNNAHAGMLWIPEGAFTMGSIAGGEWEQPVRDVHVNGFWLDETPVTNQQFASFVAATDYRTGAEKAGQAWGYRNGVFGPEPGLSWRQFAAAGRAHHPVVLVSWLDARAYCDWTGKRLPTEAEWEKAARGSMIQREYPWGNDEPNGSQCNFARQPSEIPPTTPVKQFAANGYGLHDMVGNVWHWCADYFGECSYSQGPDTNPHGPSDGSTRVRRGGSWNVIQPFRLRCANRGAAPETACAPNIGFRCAL